MDQKWIKKCCASCRYKTVDFDGNRVCSEMQIMVQQQFKCRKWHAADELLNAGHSQGVIKRREYLKFVLEIKSQGCDETLDSLRNWFVVGSGLSPFVNF